MARRAVNDHPNKHIRAAIRSAIADVQRAGSTVTELTMEEEALATLTQAP